jgi:hypothetical protein
MAEDSLVDLVRMRQLFTEDRERALEGSAAQSVSRVVAHIVRDVEIEARVGKFVLRSDEPEERGGHGSHPTPLQYFSVGVAT